MANYEQAKEYDFITHAANCRGDQEN